MLNYGLNDYLGRLPVDGDSPYDVNSYTGALRYGISELKSAFHDGSYLYEYAADHIHLNEYGRLVLATHIMETLEKILQQE